MEQDLSETESIQSTLTMWRTFYNPIIVMYNRLESSHEHLELLINFLLKNSKVFPEIFVPKSVSDDLSEEEYKSFTIWLCGRLFYIVTHDSFTRLYGMVIDSQLKILDTLRQYNLESYDVIIQNYNSILGSLNEYNWQKNSEKFIIKPFVPLMETIPNTDLELSSLEIEIDSIDKCCLIQINLIPIICHIIDSNLKEALICKTSFSDIWKNLINLAKRGTFEIQLKVFQSFLNIYQSNFSKIDSVFELKTSFNWFSKTSLSFLSFIERNDVYDDYLKCYLEFVVNLNLADKIGNFEILIDAFKHKMEHFDNNENDKEILKLFLKLFRKDCCTKLIDFKTHFEMNSEISLGFYEILIKKQLKTFLCQQKCSNFVDLLQVNETWKFIYNRNLLTNLSFLKDNNLSNIDNLNVLQEKLQEIMFSLQIAMNVGLDFRNVHTFIYFASDWNDLDFLEIANKFCIYTSSQEKNNILEIMVKIIYILIFLKHSNSMRIDDFELLIGFISYPFLADLHWNLKKHDMLNYLKNNRNIIQNKHIENQLMTLTLLPICLLNSDKSDNLGLSKKWVFNVFQFCSKSTNLEIVKKTIECIPLLMICMPLSMDKIVIDILHSIINTKLYQKEISNILTTMFCIMNSTVVYLRPKNETKSQFEIICPTCSKNEFQNNRFEVRNENIRSEINNLIFTCPKLFKSNDILIRKSVLKLIRIIISHNYTSKLPVLTEIILDFLTDTSSENRSEWLTFLPFYLTNNEKLDDTFHQQFIKTLLSITKKSLETNDAELQEMILSLIKELGQSTKITQMSYYFPVILKLMMYFVILYNSTCASLACVYFSDMLKAQNIMMNTVFQQYHKNLSKTIIELIVINYSINKAYDLSYSMYKIAITFGYKSISEFITNNCHYLLPNLIVFVIKNDAQLMPLLQDFANNSLSDLNDLLNVNFGYIYSHIYLNYDNDLFIKCLNFIGRITNIEVVNLIKRNSQVIHNELLLNFNNKPEKILFVMNNFLKNRFTFDLDELNNQRINRTEIAEYLKPILMGVLVSFDSKLVKKSVPDITKKSVLLSLTDIIKLMGSKNITSLRFKVLATLYTSLTLDNDCHQKLSLGAWKAFIETCDMEALGPLLSTIIVSILPLIDSFSSDVNSIFNYLLIENYSNMKMYFSELFFLLNFNIPESFKSIIKKSLVEFESKSFEMKIEIFLKHIIHENIDIRTHALKFLNKLLAKNRTNLNQMILCNNGLNPSIFELLDILTSGCRDNDTSLQIVYGGCLGELGAIEPSFLPQIYVSNSDSFSFYIDDDKIISFILTELTKSYQAEIHTQSINSFALAIQEVLKTFEISNIRSSKRFKIWNNLPDYIKELMLPLLSSKYKAVCENNDTVKSVHPLFGTSDITTYNNWMPKWVTRIISMINDPKYNELLKACQPCFKRDNKITMLFLPYILIQVLTESDDENKIMIFEEMIAVLTSFNTRNTRDHTLDQLSTKYTLRNPNQSLEDNSKIKCCKVMFVLLDFLDKWLNEWFLANSPQILNPKTDNNFKNVFEFFEKFCNLTISKCNFFCKEYPRALLYLEKYCEKNPDDFKNNLNFFEEIFVQLNEPDGVFGVMSVRKEESSLEERIIAHEVSGQLQDALLCYEKVLQENPNKTDYLRGMIKCYLDLDNPLMAYNLIESKLKRNSSLIEVLHDLEVESLWRLSKFEQLEEFNVNMDQSVNSWSISIGKLLISLRKGNRDNFCNCLENIRTKLIDELSMSSIENSAYQFGYPQILRLHILNEIEKIEELLTSIIGMNNIKICEEKLTEFEKELDLRLAFVQPTPRSIEPILCLRRIALTQFEQVYKSKKNSSLIITKKLNNIIGKSWLKSAEIARSNGLFHQAYAYILSAEKFNLKELFVEKAQLLWVKNDKDDAINILKRGLEDEFDMCLIENQKLLANAKLLFAMYNDEAANVDIDMNLAFYKSSVDTYKEWETNLLYLAQYYDKFYEAISDEDKEAKGSDIRIHAINCYGKSLCYGCKYLYQSMPRMLSIWLDYGKKSNRKKVETLKQMCIIIKNFTTRLPSFMFLTAFKQLSSRICHEDLDVFQTLKSIIILLILKYPQQTLWMFLSIMKSTYIVRIKRAQEILMDPSIKKNQSISKFVFEFNKLTDKLIELGNKKASNGVHNLSVDEIVPSLLKLLGDKSLPPIMLPIKKCMKILLPTSEVICNNYDPFPDNLIYIMGIDNNIQVMSSLQRPKKITLNGSDGKKHILLLKSRDDLRKDCRMMDVNDVISQYLHRDPDSRQRRLHIRTYSVVPLNDDSGLIEWIPNLLSFRSILLDLYSKKGKYETSKQVMKYGLPVTASIEDKRRVFLEKLIPLHPPIFGEWFRFMFPDPHSWFQARNAFIRTSAVMSMMGYMLGLGDRHGENILLDSKTGDIIHVDFNCIFNRGELLDCPEKVPFRLTHNMVNAMGPFGVEGIFRKACIITLRVLRANSDILMSIVEPFVYDPLVSWQASKEYLGRSNYTHIELTNEQSREYLKNVKSRLDGMMKSSKGKTSSISLSPEGQVNYLIQEATNIDNLCQMYIGWGAYL